MGVVSGEWSVGRVRVRVRVRARARVRVRVRVRVIRQTLQVAAYHPYYWTYAYGDDCYLRPAPRLQV